MLSLIRWRLGSSRMWNFRSMYVNTVSWPTIHRSTFSRYFRNRHCITLHFSCITMMNYWFGWFRCFLYLYIGQIFSFFWLHKLKTQHLNSPISGDRYCSLFGNFLRSDLQLLSSKQGYRYVFLRRRNLLWPCQLWVADGSQRLAHMPMEGNRMMEHFM